MREKKNRKKWFVNFILDEVQLCSVIMAMLYVLLWVLTVCT